MSKLRKLITKPILPKCNDSFYLFFFLSWEELSTLKFLLLQMVGWLLLGDTP